MQKDKTEKLHKNMYGEWPDENCFHCGQPCYHEQIVTDNKKFCCHGCQTVYSLLRENNLTTYYSLENAPGNTVSHENVEEKYDWLADINIQHKLLDFASESLNKVTLSLPAIHCSSCIWLLENLHYLGRGILISRVNFVKKKLRVDYDPQKTDLKAIVTLLARLGYPPDISFNDEGQNEKPKTSGDPLTIKIGVAGFCFGNIMLLSFPEYLGLDDVGMQFQRFFSFLNFLLALPVFFYSSTGYFYSAWQGLKNKFLNIDIPIALGILTLFLRSTFEILTQTGSGYFDSMAGLVFFLLVGRWFQEKTYQNLSFDRNYKSYFPLAVNKITNGVRESIPIGQLREGDEIIIRNNELIPADSILVSPFSAIDYSFVTGESWLVEVANEDYIYAGGRLKGTASRFQVQKPVSQSYLTQLWNERAFDTNHNQGSLNNNILINQVSRYFTLAVLLIALSAGVYWFMVNPAYAINAFTAVLIVACPCALALAAPFTLGNTLRIFGRKGFYLRNSEVVEQLGKIDTIVFDKTGTITHQNNSELEFFRFNPDFGTFESASLTEPEMVSINKLVANSTHPLSRVLYKLSERPNQSSGEANQDTPTMVNYEEVPGRGIAAIIDGKWIVLGSKEYLNEHLSQHCPVNEQSHSGAKVFLAMEGKFTGFFVIKNKYRQGLAGLIDNLKGKFSLALTSGDNEAERSRLQHYFPVSTAMQFNQSPASKLSFIQSLQKSQNKVMMVGDGLNDAGALQQSDFGLAVSDDINTFSPACDGIIEGNTLENMGGFVSFARYARSVIIAGFVLSFLYNMIGLGFAVTGSLTPLFAAILMPLSSITVVSFVTMMVSVKAKSKKWI